MHSGFDPCCEYAAIDYSKVYISEKNSPIEIVLIDPYNICNEKAAEPELTITHSVWAIKRE